MGQVIDKIRDLQTDYLEDNMVEPERIHLTTRDAKLLKADLQASGEWKRKHLSGDLWLDEDDKFFEPGDRILGMEIVINDQLADGPCIERASS